MEFQMKLKRFLKRETVLSVAAVLAVLSMFFVPPDADYLGYIDLRTLAILFSPNDHHGRTAAAGRF